MAIGSRAPRLHTPSRPDRPNRWRPRFFAAIGIVLLINTLAGCVAEVQPPPTLRVLELKGAPYERGLQHGRALSSEIKSFYTTMLGTSLLPYLNREQTDIAAFLKAYDPKLHPEYANGQFSYRLLLESAQELEKSIPPGMVEEMHGVADGAGVPYEQVLLLNTFVDAVLGARAVTLYLRQTQSPVITLVEVLPPAQGPAEATLGADGLDNDGDGLTDEKSEARLSYEPTATAALTEVPADARFRFLLTDPDGINPSSVRVQLVVDGVSKVYVTGDAPLQVKPFVLGNGKESPEDLDVIFTPPAGLPKAAVVTLGVQASDDKVLTEPPPAKARTMRLEQLTLSTRGYGKTGPQIRNLGASDGTTQPPSMAFALRGTATADGKPLLGHHFALLDAGTSHKHCVLQIHHPPGAPAFAMVGWAGIIYGFSGLSARGLAVGVTHADTLNNPLVGQVQKDLLAAKLIASGIPIGMAARQVLELDGTALQAEKRLLGQSHTYGWNVLLADAAGGLRAVELTAAAIAGQPAPLGYGPEAKDALGQPLSSVGADDLLATVHFRSLINDLDATVIFPLRPQRFWMNSFYSSLRTFAGLGKVIGEAYGQWTAEKAKAVLGIPALIDPNDSMQAAVLEPAARRLWVAAGKVPAAKAGFREVVLPKWEGP
jgi:hypothetical protein